MLTRRRVLTAVAVLLVAAIAYTVWIAVQTARDLRDAQSSVTALKRGIESGDNDARDRALAELQDSATSAHDHTDGLWWSAITHTPFVGDDAAGVRALSESLDVVADEAMEPLVASADTLDEVSKNGRIDVDLVRSITPRVTRAHEALERAAGLVTARSSSGYASVLRSRYDTYVGTVTDLASQLGAAQSAAEVLPDMIGADGPRDYLLVFQNNAEIRATGGLPGSWALVHADDGKLSITKQGAGGDFPALAEPVIPLSRAETAVYGPELGRFFVDAGFAPDFPRAAELMNAHWNRKFPKIHLDGVLGLDPVGMSYLLKGTGPISVDNYTLTADNAVQILLNQIYLDIDGNAAQDAVFQHAARALFDASTGDLHSPLAFVEGLARASKEGRFLVAPFQQEDATALAGARVLGALSGDDADTPHVDIGLDDATQSKMSYYLRYTADVDSLSCSGGVQRLSGSMNVRQTIKPGTAASLPRSVIGAGRPGIDAGNQFVFVRIYGPYGGTFDQVTVDGEMVKPEAETIDGRTVVSLYILLDSRDDTLINFTMSTAKGQEGDGELMATPSVAPGENHSTFASSC